MIAVTSLWIRAAYQLTEWVGMLLISVLIVFFTLPLLKDSLENFAFQNPVSDVYLSIVYDLNRLLFWQGMVAILLLMVPIIIAKGVQWILRRREEDKANEIF
ncbi:hypothetical protein QS257_02625 [Terrilactibacillus sp. S3-3]|nr:hypothetical protein QS257_02625 [Terrilactibacillus sp. S3-3]